MGFKCVYLCSKMCYVSIGWFVLVFVLMMIVFFLFFLLGSKMVLIVVMVLIGLSLGFVFLIVVSIMLELFGFNSVGVNYNIFMMNIFLGLLFYGFFVVLVYEVNIENLNEVVLKDGSMVCMGSNCYFEMFVWWGCIFLFGLVFSLLFFFSIKVGYECFMKYK